MILDVLTGGSFSITDVIIYILSALTVIFLTMPVHEFAHAYSAYKLGDNYQRYAGRLTLNPLAHIDYVGALAIILVGFGWAKPVQVNAHSFKNPKLGMALTAFAGPLANLIVAFVSLFLANLFVYLRWSLQLSFMIYVYLFFLYIAQINVCLAVFNLVPVPPLDGSKVLAAILPDRIYYKVMQYEQYLYIFLIILIVAGVLDGPLSIAVNFFMGIFNYITQLPFLLFL